MWVSRKLLAIVICLKKKRITTRSLTRFYHWRIPMSDLLLWNYIMFKHSRLRVSTTIALRLLIISKNKQIATNAYKPLPLIMWHIIIIYYYCYYMQETPRLIHYNNLLAASVWQKVTMGLFFENVTSITYRLKMIRFYTRQKMRIYSLS